MAAFRQAVAWCPRDANFLNNLGNALRELGQIEEAIACLQGALRLDPAHARAYNNLGNALGDRALLDEAVTCYRKALQVAPDYARAHSNLLCTLQYCPGVGAAELLAAHVEYERQHAARHAPTSAHRDQAPVSDRALRLGFVSPDFGWHPVGHFLLSFLGYFDPQQCQTFLYSDRRAKDDITERLERAAAHWRDVYDLGDDQLAAQIRADRIDILLDLSGHTAGNRLLVFARKPAPVQITWMGYVGTTGLSAMDYLIADRWQVPPEDERHYREKVLRMPDGYLCYEPPATAPPVGELPALKKGHVTFGSFNNPVKINGRVVALWAQILGRVPGARLMLKYRGFGDPGTRDRLHRLFEEHGVASDRVDLLGWSPHSELLQSYNDVDIALDTFPYSGGLTTCEALWMGVPVVTAPGDTFASRHSLSHLSNVGLTETLAPDREHYVEVAIGLTRQLEKLASWRRELRERTSKSALCDGRRFALNLLKLLRIAV